MNKFLKEIQEQPEALENTLRFYLDGEGKRELQKLTSQVNEKDFEHIVFTGMGSSFFVSYAAAILLSMEGRNALAVNAGEMLHYNYPELNEKTLLVCISQSGESYEIREVIKQKPANVLCAGITNKGNSTLAQNSDILLLTKAGKEEMTSTKTYITTQLVSFMLGWSIAEKWNSDIINSTLKLPVFFEKFLKSFPESLDDILDFLGEINSLPVIARGPSYSTASQSALMFMEADKVPAFSMLGGEFRHGPMEMVRHGLRSVMFAPVGKTLKQNIKMAEDIAQHGGKVLLITNSDYSAKNGNIKTVYVDSENESLFSIQSILPVQLIVDAYAKRHGFEAGSFSHGAKVTTTE